MKIGQAKKRIYTIPEGTYNGFWQGARCYLKNKVGAVLHTFDTNTFHKGKAINVRVVINCPHCEIFEL